MRGQIFRRVLIGLALVLVAVAAALTVLPARWLINALPAAWPLAVVDASGSVWRGTALVALGPAGARATLPQPVSWNAGWSNGPRLELEHPWLGCKLTLRPGLAHLGLAPCTMRLPAETLASIGAPLNTIKPAGQLQLRWPGLRLPYQGRFPSGELLTIDWRDASSALSMIHPLGSYRIDMTGTSQGDAAVALRTLQGKLHVEGNGTVTGAGFTFSGKAGPAPDASPQTVAGLQAMLSALGRRSGHDTLLQIGR